MSRFSDLLLSVSIEPTSLRVVYPYLAGALTLLVTVFYHAALKRRYGDAKGTWLYFVAFFALVTAVPLLLIVLLERNPLRVLSGLGLSWGAYRIGLILVAAFIPISVVIGNVVSKTEEMQAWYPFSKQVCARTGSFIVYEIGYLLLYYTAWEFLYRGILFFPLVNSLGFLPAAALTTALSTLHHIGHPRSEIFGALLGGILFALIAAATRSLLYAIVIHAMIGIVNDSFIYARTDRFARISGSGTRD